MLDPTIVTNTTLARWSLRLASPQCLTNGPVGALPSCWLRQLVLGCQSQRDNTSLTRKRPTKGAALTAFPVTQRRLVRPAVALRNFNRTSVILSGCGSVASAARSPCPANGPGGSFLPISADVQPLAGCCGPGVDA